MPFRGIHLVAGDFVLTVGALQGLQQRQFLAAASLRLAVEQRAGLGHRPWRRSQIGTDTTTPRRVSRLRSRSPPTFRASSGWRRRRSSSSWRSARRTAWCAGSRVAASNFCAQPHRANAALRTRRQAVDLEIRRQPGADQRPQCRPGLGHAQVGTRPPSGRWSSSVSALINS